LTLVLVIPLTLVVGVYAVIRVRQEQAQRLDDSRRTMTLAAKAVEIAVEGALDSRNTGQVQHLLDEIVDDQEDVVRIRLFDRSLAPIGATSRLALDDQLPSSALRRAIEQGQPELRYREHDGRLLLYSVVPIRGPDRTPQAAMEVVQLATSVQERVQTAGREVWLRLGMLAVAVAVLTGLVLQRQVLRPLARLMEGIRQVGEGHPGPPLPVERGDEFGRVAAAFNEMAERLEAARRKLLEETERTLDLERQLSQAETLAVAGKLAAAFAHEVGTPLNIVSGRAEFLLQSLPSDDPRRRDLGGIIDQIDRISGIIHSLLDAVRPQKPELEPVRLADVVERLLPLIEHVARREGARLTADVADTLPAVLADPGQLQQVVINLLVNAIEAVAPQGAVTLSARTESHGGTAGIAIVVADTGPGIPVAQHAAVFEPFYTTKPRGKGTGLGLSICRDIVKDHRGEIRIETRPTGGTAFVVWLPLAPPSPA